MTKSWTIGSGSDCDLVVDLPTGVGPPLPPHARRGRVYPGGPGFDERDVRQRGARRRERRRHAGRRDHARARPRPCPGRRRPRRPARRSSGSAASRITTSSWTCPTVSGHHARVVWEGEPGRGRDRGPRVVQRHGGRVARPQGHAVGLRARGHDLPRVAPDARGRSCWPGSTPRSSRRLPFRGRRAGDRPRPGLRLGGRPADGLLPPRPAPAIRRPGRHRGPGLLERDVRQRAADRRARPTSRPGTSIGLGSYALAPRRRAGGRASRRSPGWAGRLPSVADGQPVPRGRAAAILVNPLRVGLLLLQAAVVGVGHRVVATGRRPGGGPLLARPRGRLVRALRRRARGRHRLRVGSGRAGAGRRPRRCSIGSPCWRSSASCQCAIALGDRRERRGPEGPRPRLGRGADAGRAGGAGRGPAAGRALARARGGLGDARADHAGALALRRRAAGAAADECRWARAIANALPSRWAFEGLLLLESDARPAVEPPPDGRPRPRRGLLPGRDRAHRARGAPRWRWGSCWSASRPRPRSPRGLRGRRAVSLSRRSSTAGWAWRWLSSGDELGSRGIVLAIAGAGPGRSRTRGVLA